MICLIDLILFILGATFVSSQTGTNQLEANHKIKMLRQTLRREHKVPHEKLQHVDLAEVPCEE
jgi:hypothetical protein